MSIDEKKFDNNRSPIVRWSWGAPPFPSRWRNSDHAGKNLATRRLFADLPDRLTPSLESVLSVCCD